MRLSRVGHAHRLREKVLLLLIRVMSGRMTDVLRTLMYRPELFGQPFSAWTHEALRGESVWSVGERELFAAFVSRRNQCLF